MRILRDLAHSSRVLILLELRRRPARTLRPLAQSVGLTQQAVSGYVKRLEQEQLVRRAEGAYRLTARGEDFLANEVSQLKAFADGATRELVHVEACAAIAGEALREGEKVGLFMIGGRLVAFARRESPSSGFAVADARKGADVHIRDLRGIVDIAAASLVVVEAPAPDQGGSGAVDLPWWRSFASAHRHAAFAALDEVGEAFLVRAGAAWKFEFAPLESARAALARGLNLVYVGAPDTVALLTARVEAAKAQGHLDNFRYEKVRARAVAPDARRKA